LEQPLAETLQMLLLQLVTIILRLEQIVLIVQLQIYLHHTLLQVTWVAAVEVVVLVVQLVPLAVLVERRQL
jgi:hypothetical protein